MSDDHRTEYITAFAVGALLGAGAALLLAPDPPTRRERIAKELKPYRKRMRKQASRVRRQAGDQAATVAEWRDELAAASWTILEDLRKEVGDVVRDARKQIANAVDDQVDAAHASLRRGTKRIRPRGRWGR